MNININPSAVAVDTAANLLEFLELAKDPSKLKAVVGQIKTAQDASAAEAAAAAKAISDLKAAESEISKQRAKLDQDSAAQRATLNDLTRKVDEANAISEAAKAERAQLDAWMAAQREALANDQAAVASAADQNDKRAEALARAEGDVSKRMDQVADLEAAALALKADYETKLAGLKAMVG
jgi:exonuclease SbcC